MKHLNEYRARPRMGRALAVAAVLLCVSALSEPNLAYAGPHGGGGGSHSGGGEFHGGGFHAGGFAGFHGRFAGMHRGFDERHDGFRGRRDGFGIGLGFGYYPYGWDSYPDYNWYYCSDPAGYYPYVPQCNVGWQTVPAS